MRWKFLTPAFLSLFVAPLQAQIPPSVQLQAAQAWSGTAGSANAGWSIASGGGVILTGSPGGSPPGPGVNSWTGGPPPLGPTGAGTVQVRASVGGQVLNTLLGEAGGDRFGFVVCNIGDVDGDTAPDFAIGAPFGGGGTGRVYVYANADLQGPFTPSPLFVLSGFLPNDRFGVSVCGIGDITGDGLDEFVVGAPKAGLFHVGQAYVFSPQPGGAQLLAPVMNGEAVQPVFGGSLAAVGDLDGDGRSEIAIGASGSGDTPQATTGAGRVYIFRGSNRTLLGQINGPVTGGLFGYSISRLGDVSVPADGIPDFAVGAPRSGSLTADDSGRVFIYSGATRALMRTFSQATPGDLLGAAVVGTGNADADAQLEVAIGSPGSGLDGRPGRVLLVGASDGVVKSTVSGERPNDRMGMSIGVLDDINFDGRPELLAGSPNHDMAENVANRMDDGRGMVFVLPRTLYVSATAGPGGNGSYATPYASIGMAIASARHGDTIFVGPGTYAESLFLNVNVRLVGAGTTPTIIDPGPNALLGALSVGMGTDDTCLLEGLTFRQVLATAGGATIRNCRIGRLNVVRGYLGSTYVDRVDIVRLDHCTIDTLHVEGPILPTSLGDPYPLQVQMDHCSMRPMGTGLAPIFTRLAELTLTNSIIWDPTSSVDILAPTGSPVTTPGPEGSLVRSRYCVMAYNTVGFDPTNVVGDPKFANASAGDLRLRIDSPAIDAGDPAAPLDPDGSRSDVGASYAPPDHLPGSADRVYLATALNALPLGAAGSDIHPAQPGNAATFSVWTTNTALLGSPMLVLAQGYPALNSIPPTPGLPAFIRLNPYVLPYFVLFGTASPIGLPVLSGTPTTFALGIPPGLAGITIRVQAFAVSPLALAAGIAASSAHEFVVN